MPTLKQIVEGTDTRPGKTFNLAIQALIVLSLVTFSLETLPNISAELRTWLRRIEVITVAVFTIEYAVRLWVADNRLRFATSFFGIIDLVAIMPFYIGTGVDLRSIRAFRMLRLFRILKMARYSTAIQRFHRAFIIAREEMVLFLCVTGIVIFLAAVGIYYFENPAQPEKFASVFHSLWWAVATLTTVGYGDVYPITAGGKLFTFAILLVGLGIVAIPTGLVATALAEARKSEEPEATSTVK